MCRQNGFPVLERDRESVINARNLVKRRVHFEIVTRGSAIKEGVGVHVIVAVIMCSRQNVETIVVSSYFINVWTQISMVAQPRISSDVCIGSRRYGLEIVCIA